ARHRRGARRSGDVQVPAPPGGCEGPVGNPPRHPRGGAGRPAEAGALRGAGLVPEPAVNGVVKRFAEQLGLAGVLGIGVLLFCATFYFSTLRPAQDELAARHSAAAGTSVSVQPVAHSTDPLAELHSRFPALDTLPAQVERLHRIARSTGLQLQHGDYRLEVPPAG